VGVIFHEAETTRRLLEAVQTHDQTLDLSDLGKQLVNLFFGGVKGPGNELSVIGFRDSEEVRNEQVSNVEGRRVGKLVIYFFHFFIVTIIAAISTFALAVL
jgi:hypothetical protein